MFLWGIAQLAGGILLLRLPELPHPGVFILTLPFCLAALASRWRWLAGLWLGAALAAWQADHNLDDRLAVGLDGQVVEVTGRIVDLVEADGQRQRFRFRIESGTFKGEAVDLPREVRLSLYDDDGRRLAVATGERWRWAVKLRRPRGFANPGGFDYERWLFAEGLGATGYVRNIARAVRLEESQGEWRAAVAARVAALAEGPGAGLVRGLATGDRAGIDNAQWDVLRLTGTAHLMAISGLHIALVSGMALSLAAWIRRRAWPDAGLYWPPLAGGVAALVYGALAGFGLPVQRALVAGSAVLFALASRRRITPGHAFGVALTAVLWRDPLASLDVGFWLSFGAVAAIVFALTGRRPAGSRIFRALLVQAGLFVLMAPLIHASFGRVPLLSPVANLVAIPVFDLVAVPLVLLGLVLLAWPGAAGALFSAAGWILEHILALLEFLAGLDPGWVPAALPLAVLGGAMAAFTLLCAPRSWPGRAFAPWLLLPAIVLSPGPRHAPPLALHFLDVGQGVAVIVETPERTLVYDTGPRFGDSDAASLVVVPFLEARGRRPDLVMVSHGDSDHAGGIESLQRRYPGIRITGRVDPQDGVDDCADMAWEWEGVSFRVLHPAGDMAGADNDMSCVLRIEAGDFSVLLAGDIEAGAEAQLVREQKAALTADIVLVPHHGSRTSSTKAFIRAVAPRLAVVGAGHGNQWNFPKPDVVKRWRAQGAQLLETGAQGCISVTLDGEFMRVESLRNERTIWREPAAVPGVPYLPVR